MSPEQKRTIATIDLDNVIFHSWPTLPTKNQFLEKQQRIIVHSLFFLRKFFDSLKPIIKEAPNGLKALKSKGFLLVGLSGRPIEFHPLTEKRLKREGILKHFHSLFLNSTTQSSGEFKSSVIEYLVNNEYFVVHIEDDPEIAVKIAQINPQKVCVFLVRNFGNHQAIINQAGIHLPENVFRINNIGDVEDIIITADFWQQTA